MAAPAWLAALEPRAPDIVAVWRTIDDEGPVIQRPGLPARDPAAGGPRQPGENPGPARGHRRCAGAILTDLPESAAARTGGEGDWNVAQAFAHTTGSRRWLAHAGALAAVASGRPTPAAGRAGRPGPGRRRAASAPDLLGKSRRSLATSAEAIAGHESEPCPLDHPLVGHLRCGEWFLFAGVHDLMHLEQLHGSRRAAASEMAERPAPADPRRRPKREAGRGPAVRVVPGVSVAGRRRLAVELSRRLIAAGSGVAALHPRFRPTERHSIGGAGMRPPPARWSPEFGRRAGLSTPSATPEPGRWPWPTMQLIEALVSAIPARSTANNRYSRRRIPGGGQPSGVSHWRRRWRRCECSTDNAAMRCLEAAGFAVARPLDGALVPLRRGHAARPGAAAAGHPAAETRRPDGVVTAFLEMAVLPGGGALEVPHLPGIGAVLRDRDKELVVAGRVPSSAWAYLETESACRVRCFIEERGMRSARDTVRTHCWPTGWIAAWRRPTW